MITIEMKETRESADEMMPFYSEASQMENMIESYLRKPITLSPAHTCEEAYDIFQEESEECIVICEDGNVPIGLMMKNLFYRQIGSGFGHSLFFNKSVTMIMEKEPLILNQATPIEQIIDLALNRSDEFLYDCILLTEQNKLTGVLTFSDLLTISSILQRQASKMHLQSIHSTEQMITNINRSVSEVDHSIVKGLDLSEAMVTRTLDGKQAIQEIIHTFQRLNLDVDSIEQQIQGLEQRSKSIQKFVSSIQEIAEQTNILSINASIEAARAGDHGKGFSVVADEIRKLANDTKQYSEEVRKIIEHISEGVVESVSIAKSGKNEAADSMKHIQNATVVFEQLFDQVSESTANMKEIHQLSDTANKEGHRAHEELQSLVTKLEASDTWGRVSN